MGRENDDVRINSIMPVLTERWLLIDWEKSLNPVTYPIDSYKQTNYKTRGKYAIVDQGRELVSGYIDEDRLLYRGELPVVIFGDHTRVIKYIDFPFALGADGCKILLPIKAFILRFFFYYVSSLNLISDGYSRHYKYLKTISVPLPPLGEQQRIVARLDALLPKVQSAQARLATIPGILKKFRQSVLAAACSGHLTEDWREGKDFPEWEEVKLGEISELITKGASPNWQGIKYVESPGILFITSENVYNSELKLETKKYVESSFNDKQKRSILKKGDLLTNIVGASIGRTALYNLDNLANINQAVALIRLRNTCNKHFYLLYLNSPEYISKLHDEKVDVARANISLTDLKEMSVPLPPLEEQHEIVRRVEKLFALADSLAAKYDQARARVAKLEHALLAKAFRGELAPPDPHDEPAEELLKRIFAEKATLAAGKQPRKKK